MPPGGTHLQEKALQNAPWWARKTPPKLYPLGAGAINRQLVSFLHLGVRADVIPDGFHCHHLLLEDWEDLEAEQGVIFVSIPTLLDPSLAPEGRHIVHTFTMSDIKPWSQLSPADYKHKKQQDAERLIQRLEAILPGLGDAIELRKLAHLAPTAVS